MQNRRAKFRRSNNSNSTSVMPNNKTPSLESPINDMNSDNLSSTSSIKSEDEGPQPPTINLQMFLHSQQQMQYYDKLKQFNQQQDVIESDEDEIDV